jgi:NADH-quinone oxidoreductase subunit J
MASLVFFYFAAALVLGGAITVVMTRNIIYAAFGLLTSLMGIAALFLLTFAEFLALVQVLIYGGAVVIVIIFALMLTRLDDFRQLSDHKGWPLGAAAALALFGLMIAAIVRTPVNTGPREGVSFTVMGESLFQDWAVPFEIASLVLLIALIGAVVMVRRSDPDDGANDDGGPN